MIVLGITLDVKALHAVVVFDVLYSSAFEERFFPSLNRTFRASCLCQVWRNGVFDCLIHKLYLCEWTFKSCAKPQALYPTPLKFQIPCSVCSLPP